MKDEILGLIAGLILFASTTAVLLEQKIAGVFLGVVGLAFAVALGLSKRAKNKGRAKSL